MRLADRIAQSTAPFIVQNTADGSVTQLNSASSFAKRIESCPVRYVLSDGLTGLCAALVYSKGAKNLVFADLLHMPAERLWIEWTQSAWLKELNRYGFKRPPDAPWLGRRGVFIESTKQGRSGLMRTFWSSGNAEADVLASSMEAYFDFDTDSGDAPIAATDRFQSSFCVFDDVVGDSDILRRCFRFRFERSWQDYYHSARLTSAQRAAISRHALGTIALDIPVILAFCLLLATRPNLPRRPLMLEQINRLRSKVGKRRLLDQVEVCAPLLSEYRPLCGPPTANTRRASRLHHVRGHLVRRGNQLFWRVPHMRGNARSGVLRARTVTWLIDASERQASTAVHVDSRLI